MSRQDNNNMAMMRMNVNLKKLYERISNGKIGDHFSEMMGNEEVALCYAEGIIEWVNEKVENFADQKLKRLFEKLMMPQNLFINFQINIITIVFEKALMQWINNGGEFENIIIKNIDIRTIKEAIKMLQDSILGIIDDPESLRQLENVDLSNYEGSQIMIRGKNSIDEYLKDIDPIRIMKFKNNKYLN